MELDLKYLLGVAKYAALKAGRIINASLGKELNVQLKGEGLSLASSVVTEVDLLAQSAIFEVLKESIERFDLGLLSEEQLDNKSRFVKDFFWCVDPLDGTLPFTEQVQGYSVAIALVSKIGTPVLGVIYDPFRNNLYEARVGRGVFKNEVPYQVERSNNQFTFITDRSFMKTGDFDTFIQKLKVAAKDKGLNDFKIISHGGASMNAIWVLENAPAAYIKLPKISDGGGGLWDFTASACIFSELNLKATNYAGGKLDLNRIDSIFMNHEGVWFES